MTINKKGKFYMANQAIEAADANLEDAKEEAGDAHDQHADEERQAAQDARE